MRRSILSVVAMFLAFVAGVGVDRLIRDRSGKINVPAPRMEVVERVETPVVPAMPVAVQPKALESRIIYNFDEEKFYPIGTYSFLGATPKEFTEIASFMLDYEVKNGEAFGYIEIYTESGEYHESNAAIFGSVNERRLIFLTGPNPKTGFEYFFDGEFLRKDLDELSGLDQPVLKGMLIKMKDGRKVAERVVSFVIQQYGC